MPVYAVRKRGGHWTVSSGNHVLLDFDSYDEAVETTQTAMRVLKPSGGLKSPTCPVSDVTAAEIAARKASH
jgi:hypothetical protein